MSFLSLKEMTRRVGRLREKMRERSLSCIMSWSFHSNYYLSGFYMPPWGGICVQIIPIEGDAILITPKMEEQRAEEQIWIRDIRSYSDEENPIIAVVREIKGFMTERNLTKASIGIEEDSIRESSFKVLRKELSTVEFVDVSDALGSLRLVKSDEEINLIRMASGRANVGVVAFSKQSRKVGLNSRSALDANKLCKKS